MLGKLSLVFAASLIIGVVLIKGAGKTESVPGGSPPSAPVVSGQEDTAFIVGQTQDFIRSSKASSFQADFVINVSQNGEPLPLFPAEFRMNYSSNLDKFLLEVTSPPIAVGSAMLIHRRPGMIARGQSEQRVLRNVAFAQDIVPVEVADGCSGSVCDIETQQCGDCDSGTILTASAPGSVKPSGTFRRLLDSGAFDLPFLTDFAPTNFEKVGQETFKGEPSTKVRLDRTQVANLGLGDVVITIRHRDAAPVGLEVFDRAGQISKKFEVSFVNHDMVEMTATDLKQNLVIHIALKDTNSLKRNVKLGDETFTRDNLLRILEKRTSKTALSAE